MKFFVAFPSILLISYCVGVTPVQAPIVTEELKQRSCLVELLYYEGRNTGYEGMRSIAMVVHNRTKHPKRFGRNYCETSYEYKQFSFHADKHKQKKPTEKDDKAFRLAMLVAKQVQMGYIPSTLDSVLYYHTKSSKPSWAKQMKLMYTDKHHNFYEERKSK